MDGEKGSGLIAASNMNTNLMKKNLTVAFFGFAIVFNSFSAPTSAEQLRSEFEAALKAKDTNAVLALVNWKSVSDKMKPEIIDEMTGMVMPKAVSVNLLPLPADYQPTNEMDGVRYYPNVHVLGQINVETTEKGNASQIPYGESGGIFYIAGVVQETFDAHATKSKSLGLSVSGLFSPTSPGILTCSYVYLASGKEKTGGFQCTNNWSTGFWGDYIKSCKVTKISGSGSYQLIINEGTTTVFNSRMVETNDSISYERKQP
jgi:hypothetical protein